MPNKQPSSNSITTLQPDEVFVFGANLAGRHGKGAAKQALQFGAKYGHIGRSGQSYGIPTKDEKLNALSIKEISQHLGMFFLHACNRPHTKFLVTEIGCGLAGYQPKDIAYIFRETPDNIYIPQSFLDILHDS